MMGVFELKIGSGGSTPGRTHGRFRFPMALTKLSAAVREILWRGQSAWKVGRSGGFVTTVRQPALLRLTAKDYPITLARQKRM